MVSVALRLPAAYRSGTGSGKERGSGNRMEGFDEPEGDNRCWEE